MKAVSDVQMSKIIRRLKGPTMEEYYYDSEARLESSLAEACAGMQHPSTKQVLLRAGVTTLSQVPYAIATIHCVGHNGGTLYVSVLIDHGNHLYHKWGSMRSTGSWVWDNLKKIQTEEVTWE